ncbi:MAG: DNA primase [Firmicutes bacterium ADurb.Bin456]|jgi:DNA primase|nr:MAG: DNA primase [Firmicutes bacterium ADurb.Bin456]
MTKMDFEGIKNKLDILAVIESDLGQGKKSGRYHLFCCPFHTDKTPSLAVTPDDGRFYCFSCGQSGDVIDWLKQYRKLSYQAIADLTGAMGIGSNQFEVRLQPTTAPPRPAVEHTHTPAIPPGATWQAAANDLIAQAESALWSPGGIRALEYLKGRGLSDRTIKRFRLGYHPEDQRIPVAKWGSPIDESPLYIPRGILIPCIVGGVVWYIKIRRPKGTPKYLNIRGGKPALFGADHLRGAELVILTEGELDAILTFQELGDVCGVATFGSATARPDLDTWGEYLITASTILTAYDLDNAGRHGLEELTGTLGTARPLQVPQLNPGDKDITDYYLAGGDLWKWLEHNLNQIEYFSRLASL